MPFSWDEWNRILANTYEVCPNGKRGRVTGYHFKGGIYEPPIDLGYSAQIITIMPALHGYGPDGNKTHVHSASFLFKVNLN